MGKETLTHRERVIAAIEHKAIDRYPIDLGSHFSTGISAFAYQDLCEYLGLSTDNIEMIDNVQALARVEDAVIERFHVDTKLIVPRWKDTVKWNPRGNYTFDIPKIMNVNLDAEGNWIVKKGNDKMRMPKGGYFFDGEWLSLSELDYNDCVDATIKLAEEVRKNGDFFNMHMQYSGYFNGMDFACDMYTDPDSIITFNEEICNSSIETVGKLINKAGGYIDCVALNSDLGMQNAPMLSPEMYEKFCMPYVKRFCDFVHQNSDMKVFLHSCGAIEPLLPYIIEGGVDCLNPVQISASGMDAVGLKTKYGKDICFWGGGCNTQHILSAKTPLEVSQNVKELTDIFKTDGGFVFNQVHNIMGNVKPENIVAMFDTAYENSFYN